MHTLTITAPLTEKPQKHTVALPEDGGTLSLALNVDHVRYGYLAVGHKIDSIAGGGFRIALTTSLRPFKFQTEPFEVTRLKRQGGWAWLHPNGGYAAVVDGALLLPDDDGSAYIVDTPEEAVAIAEAVQYSSGRTVRAGTYPTDLAAPTENLTLSLVGDGLQKEITGARPTPKGRDFFAELSIDGILYGAIRVSPEAKGRIGYSVSLSYVDLRNGHFVSAGGGLTRPGGWIEHRDAGYVPMVNGKGAFPAPQGKEPMIFDTEHHARAVVRAALHHQRLWQDYPIEVLDRLTDEDEW